MLKIFVLVNSIFSRFFIDEHLLNFEFNFVVHIWIAVCSYKNHRLVFACCSLKTLPCKAE